MALGIVKIYLGSPFSTNRRCSRSVGWRSVVVEPLKVPENFKQIDKQLRTDEKVLTTKRCAAGRGFSIIPRLTESSA